MQGLQDMNITYVVFIFFAKVKRETLQVKLKNRAVVRALFGLCLPVFPAERLCR